jgi:predicted pyridoxine 5'-phosphate oxidase superfamily flavin-nucleotide-binding protein
VSEPEDMLFSPAVKAEQTRLGSRAQFEGRAWNSEITDDLRRFLAAIDTFFFATASADGRPYVQHRGGPAGFLKPIGSHMLAFADFAGNRQYITLGHLKENDRAHVFIPHFATQQRLKLWGRARVIEDGWSTPLTRRSRSARSPSESRPGTSIVASTSWHGTARPKSHRP